MSLLQNTDAVELESDISLELYLRRVYRPDCDYIDGKVRERNAGYWPHSEMMVVLGTKLDELAKASGTVVLMSVRIRVSDDCVLVPDLCLARRTRPREDVIVTPPLLCVEIITPEDTLLALQDRIQRFQIMGVENLWLVEERGRFAWVATSTGLERVEELAIASDGRKASINLNELASTMNE